MKETIRAILHGRCGGDLQLAHAYCMKMHLALYNNGCFGASVEYMQMGIEFKNRLEAQREQLQRTRTVFAPGCSA